jgi:hypothetical protein
MIERRDHRRRIHTDAPHDLRARARCGISARDVAV